MKRIPKPIAWIKVYDADGNYHGSLVHAEDAAALVSMLGNGANARNGHSQKRVIWFEGKEDFPAGDSYDRAAEYMHARVTHQSQRCSHCKGDVVASMNGGMRHVWWRDQNTCGEPTEVEEY